MLDSDIEVSVLYMEKGADGPGWYCWESEYPEEGYFFVLSEKPTIEDLKAINHDYVFKNNY